MFLFAVFRVLGASERFVVFVVFGIAPRAHVFGIRRPPLLVRNPVCRQKSLGGRLVAAAGGHLVAHDPRAVEVDLSKVKMKWLSPPVVAVSLELSETLTDRDVVLDLSCDAFDDGRPAVAGGALVALVCWPEVGPFSSETITRALPKSLPHACTPLPRATAAGARRKARSSSRSSTVYLRGAGTS